ncbi:transposase [Chryseobacterium sp. LAM-KRS1]|uniref:transposase n=1 Tax=Chryseobacterium sp. LAM-KRS1 TaxID=2715754 RepID=UPI00155388D9|nr:transposase [Chryseobacterium sp. LAM-KRS1]
MNKFKDIHLGQLIEQLVNERKIGVPRICKFLNITVHDISEVYKSESMDTKQLIKWSKLLEYDFFRIYSQHLILYAPPSSADNKNGQKTDLPKFRKNIYTRELITYILEVISTGEMTKLQVIELYGIPKSTLYKWFEKYGS